MYDIQLLHLKIQLHKYKITKYTIDDKLQVTVHQSILWNGMRLTDLPDLNIIKVHGYFNCADNNLTSLKHSPIHVTGYFDCNNNNKLASLEHAPKFVDGNYYCFWIHNTVKFTKDDIKYFSKVSGDIYGYYI